MCIRDSFRGGDASQFVLLPKIKNANDDEVLQVRENVLMNYGVEQKQLNTNYRSVAAIVSFNNDFYSSIPPLLDENISLVYNDVAQECFKKNEAGFVSAQFFEKDVFKEAYIEEIVKIISDAKAKNFEYKDIAILVQRKLKGAEIATALLERNIPVLSDESLFL